MTTNDNARRPRVVLLTYPSLAGAAIIQQMTRQPGINVVGIGLSGRVFKGANHVQAVSRMTRRTGGRFTAYAIAMTDLAWLALRAVGRPRALTDRNVDVHTIADINGGETYRWLESLEPDYVASCYFNQIIGPAVTRIPRRGCVNLHAALLPALRGPEPNFRALERDLTESGLTVHRVDEGIDAGPILHQERRVIPPGASLGELDATLWPEGGRVLAEWLVRDPGTLGGRPNTADAEEDYDTWPTADEVARLRRSGKHLLRWSSYFRSLWNIIRERPQDVGTGIILEETNPA